MDTVTLGEGATLGPNGVILPAASIEQGATVGPGSLVLRGEAVPAGSRWTGNPIAPWPQAAKRSRSVRVEAPPEPATGQRPPRRPPRRPGAA
jgi:carbonic anhydrase/acetyltransferase-like protein (isoleucine patch superfamily)